MQTISKQDILNELQDIFEKYNVDKVWLFGSRSRGDNRPDSDIDLCYERKEKYDIFHELNAISLQEELNTSDLPVEVHLTNIRNVLEKDTSITRSIKKDLILIYEKE